MRWTVVELYSEVCYHVSVLTVFGGSDTQLYHTIDPPNAVTPSRGDSTQSKRRKISDPLTNLIAATRHGAYGTRLQALQTIIFLVDQHWEDVHLELQTDIRQQMIALLDEDEPSLQSWAFIGIATLATLPARPASASDLEAMIPSPVTQARALSAETDFARAWTYAIQKTGLVGVYRSACLAAHSLLKYAKVDSTIAIKDIGFVLEGVDIRGPPFPLDSACALLDEMLTLARQDVRLYSIGLEAKVVSWFAKWNAVEGMRGKGRIDQHFLSDILPLLCNSAHLQSPVFYQPSTLDFLPDCAIVDRVLEEERTQPIRQFSLYGTISDTRDIVSPSRAIMALPEVDLSSAAFLDGLPRRISDTITSFVETFCQTWPAQVEGEARPAIPADRCRRTVDMLVLAINFQATLQANSIRSDSTCIQASLRLLDLLLPVLKSSGYDVISQHLMWKGLEPLIYSIVPPTPSVWPILLRPNEMSGVRKDILPKGGELAAEKSEEERAREDDFLVLLWEVADVSSAPHCTFAFIDIRLVMR
jgi:ataxia telangiectasia mutated family protein